MAFIGCGAAPVELSGSGKVGSPQDWAPGADTRVCGETLLSGKGGSEIMCVCVRDVSIAIGYPVFPRLFDLCVLLLVSKERHWILTQQSSFCLVVVLCRPMFSYRNSELYFLTSHTVFRPCSCLHGGTSSC